MKCKIHKDANMEYFKEFKPLLTSFLKYATKNIGFHRPPSLFFASDKANASNMLARTAHYDPEREVVTVYIDGRHPKDILRSISHELVHHKQNCDGKFNVSFDTGPGYAQNNDYLRSMEKEAYLLGNLCFRDWEDMYKMNLQESKFYNKGEIKMDTKQWSRKELNILLMEKFGYKTPETMEEEMYSEEVDEDMDTMEEEKTPEHDEDMEEAGFSDEQSKNLPDGLQKAMLKKKKMTEAEIKEIVKAAVHKLYEGKN